ncbi:JmjC domain-containing protein [Streptomyces sp. NPDC088251]|uniref:JmjC domain-containing protein n=1 Tax=Streptomyces sp. NPDC088251 TaxID=3365844 RepID=UPI003809367E
MTEPLTVVNGGFDWPAFTEQHWDRNPVLYRSVAPSPFTEPDVFAAAAAACRTGGDPAAAPPPNAGFTVERVQRTRPGPLLPRPADGSFDGYQGRLSTELAGRRHALVISGFHAFDFSLWAREREFFAGLWERVGLPLTGAITTLFHGTYEHSPVGVHKDRFATFMFGLKGRKRMRFWRHRPWQEPVSTVLDYARYRGSSFEAEVGPGDLLYWPSGYYHVGESAGSAPATSVNVGVPREEHRAGYELEDLLVDLDPAGLTGRPSRGSRLAPVDAPVLAPPLGPDGLLSPVLPEGLRRSADAFRQFGDPRLVGDRVTTVALRRWTAGGFEPVPGPAGPRRLADGAVVEADPRYPVRWAPLGTADTAGTICAANGHDVATAAGPCDLLRLLDPLLSGKPVAVADLLAGFRPAGTDGPADAVRLPADREGMRRLLEKLESFRGLTRVTGPGG